MTQNDESSHHLEPNTQPNAQPNALNCENRQVSVAQEHPTRVLLVEDHAIYREGLRVRLQSEQGFQVVGEAQAAHDALTLTRHLQPDVIVLDLDLGGKLCLDLARQLHRVLDQVKVVILTAHHEREYLLAALRSGAEGFLHKDMPSAAIVDAIHQVARGYRVLGEPQTWTAVLEEFETLLRTHDREFLGLTEGEVEILRFAAGGCNNREIGEQKFWSEITVKRKMHTIYEKLNVRSRTQAVAEAIRLGFL